MIKYKSCTEIAQEDGVSRQAVHQCIKRSIKKLFFRWKEVYKEDTIETIKSLIQAFGIKDEETMKDFIGYLPSEVKKEIISQKKLTNDI